MRRSGFWWGLALVVLAAAGLRVVYVLTVTRHDTHFYDAAYYQLEADSLANGDGFVDPFAAIRDPGSRGGPSAEHPPLTSIILVPAALVDDKDTSALLMRFTMVLVGLGVIVVVGLLGRELGGDTVGLIAAGIAALNPNLWMNDGLIMSEPLSTLLVAAALLLAYRVLRDPSLWWVVGLGAGCGLLALVRAELAVLTLALAVPAVWIGSRQGPANDEADPKRTSRRVGRAVVCVAVALAVAVPWVGYNLSRFEKPTFVSTNDGLTMRAANCDQSYYGSGIGHGDIRCATDPPKGDPSVANAAYRSQAFDYLGDHMTRLPLVVAARMARLWSVFRVPQTVGFDVGEGRPRWASYLGIAALYLLVLLATFGVVAARRRRVTIWPLVVPIVVVTATMLIVAGVPRYRAAAEPSIVVLAALGIAALVTRLNSSSESGRQIH